MTIEEVHQRIARYIKEGGHNHWVGTSLRDAIFVAWVESSSPLSIEYPWRERVLALIDNPICPLGQKKKFKSINRGWAFCDRYCECAKKSVLEKSRATLLKRYGVEHQRAIPGVDKKIRAGNKKTEEERADINRKRRATNQYRYGVEYISQHEASKEKMRCTNKKKYGVEYPMQNSEIQDRVKNDPTISDRRKKTNIEKYGVEFSSQRNLSQKTLDILMDRDKLQIFCEGRSFTKAADELGIHHYTVLRYWKQYSLPVKRSSYEDEIAAFLDERSIIYMQNTRQVVQGYELDFFIPDQKLAIEFNGLYWHSEFNKENNYHYEKMRAALAAGIRIIMVNEDEWKERNPVVKSRILNMLGQSPRGVGARMMDIQTIDRETANAFFEKHHLQGRTGSILFAKGAYHNGVLMGAMAFNKQRGTQDIELIRFCSTNMSHPGLFSRLFRKSVEEWSFERVISFADLRYSEGDVYSRNGFELVKKCPPDYRYILRDKTFHKSSFTKAKITKKFGIDVKSEREAMWELKIPRIYDCGKLKFEWTNNS